MLIVPLTNPVPVPRTKNTELGPLNPSGPAVTGPLMFIVVVELNWMIAVPLQTIGPLMEDTPVVVDTCVRKFNPPFSRLVRFSVMFGEVLTPVRSRLVAFPDAPL